MCMCVDLGHKMHLVGHGALTFELRCFHILFMHVLRFLKQFLFDFYVMFSMVLHDDHFRHVIRILHLHM